MAPMKTLSDGKSRPQLGDNSPMSFELRCKQQLFEFRVREGCLLSPLQIIESLQCFEVVAI